MSRFESYSERLVIKGINPRPAIAVERVAPALVKVDGDNGVGPLVAGALLGWLFLFRRARVAWLDDGREHWD